MTLCTTRPEALADLADAYVARFGREPKWLPLFFYCRGPGNVEARVARVLRLALWAGKPIRIPRQGTPRGMPGALVFGGRRGAPWRWADKTT